MEKIFEKKRINIDISLLQEKEREELMLFYQFLLFKSGTIVKLEHEEEDINSLQQDAEGDFFKSAGMWENRDITQEQLRKKAWKKD